MDAYVLDWVNLLVRWLHLIAGIAWIGASFHFVMLESSLAPPAQSGDRERAGGVRGGGFHLSRKFLTGPTKIAAQAAKIVETVGNGSMPIGNLTQMRPEERAFVTAWVAQGAKTR